MLASSPIEFSLEALLVALTDPIQEMKAREFLAILSHTHEKIPATDLCKLISSVNEWVKSSTYVENASRESWRYLAVLAHDFPAQLAETQELGRSLIEQLSTAPPQLESSSWLLMLAANLSLTVPADVINRHYAVCPLMLGPALRLHTFQNPVGAVEWLKSTLNQNAAENALAIAIPSWCKRFGHDQVQQMVKVFFHPLQPTPDITRTLERSRHSH